MAFQSLSVFKTALVRPPNYLFQKDPMMDSNHRLILLWCYRTFHHFIFDKLFCSMILNWPITPN